MTPELASTGGNAPRTRPLTFCPLCGGGDIPVFFEASDRLHGTPGKFTYCHCGTCGTVFQNPRIVPEDLGACYPAEYGTHQSVTSISMSAAPQPTFRMALRQGVEAAMDGHPPTGIAGLLGYVLASVRKVRERTLPHPVIDEMRPSKKGGAGKLRALDIGCGAGKLMISLQSLGWQIEGIEWDPVAANVARTASGLKVQEGDFRRADLPVAGYNLIVLSHCFEHLDDPIEALQKLRELLKADGRLVLIYPNPQSFGARLYGKAWFDWDPPRHLVIPPLPSLARAAEKLGFRVVVYRSLAREAKEHLVHSRAISEGKPPAEVRVPTARWIDRTYARLERILTLLGARLGEEAVLVLEIAPTTH